jgi:hypothetical protein
MAKNRNARPSARKSSNVVVLNAAQAEALAPFAADETLAPDRVIETAPYLDPATGVDVAGEQDVIDSTEHYTDPAPIDPTDGYDGLSHEEMEAQQNTTEPADPHLAEIAAGTDVPDEALQDEIDAGDVILPGSGIEPSPIPSEVDGTVVNPGAQEPASETGDLSEQALALARETETGRMLITRFPTSDEAIAYASNMRLRNVNYSKQEDGQWAIIVRKPTGKPASAPQTTEEPAQAPARSAPKSRAPRAKASGPRPDTRNAVIWAGLTRPDGVTKKEIDALLAAFQPDNIQPCGIGSDAKLFSSRFGYDYSKTLDPDGATRYRCFPFASESETESEPEVLEQAPQVVEGEPAQEPTPAQEPESAAS